MEPMYAVILAAGIGSRLGQPTPKPLTRLANGERILDRQLSQLRALLDPERILVVVGFKKELIMEAHPELLYLYNANFDVTNTAVSLALALRKTADADVLMLNGDVVCDAQVLQRLLRTKGSTMAVNQAPVGAEEVKYQLDAAGTINAVSKQVQQARGEALGVNLFRATDIPHLRAGLDRCTPEDYFERGIELAIGSGLRIRPVDVSDLRCIEVDFPDDLARAGQDLAPVAG
ncbi:putative sugar nucleotidyltransferase [Thiorhodovibrio frisius]|uniref:Putative sugar nucleotidyltransferase n=2 Tax=Thiorhodovibrio frisius TaxID=631362 RepID=H8Z4C7_9GAMM|nr:putative sugar nucleotidyltransferase [Thiorhodovibrio frisius]WPL20921.1 bifunctional N-acetylglucosamine-1-phosphate uridyltransferase/glucosamine-1-phosphate acetyltransferase [Thiorhodovibrio frisius]